MVKYYTDSMTPKYKSLFRIWEEGKAFKDSITPSAHVEHYREHIIRQITGHSPTNKNILSLGCGNGFVEARLVKTGYTVNAIDTHPDAVQLSCEKGVNAKLLDFFDLSKADFEDVGCVYADGLIGHLYSEKNGLNPFISHMKDIACETPTYCVLSNDAPLERSLKVQKHEAVTDFWYISAEFLFDLLMDYGFTSISSQYYPYERPLSGERLRTIVSFSILGV